MTFTKCLLSAVAWLVAVLALMSGPIAWGQAGNSAKTVLHDDGTVTESVSDLEKGEMRETTYDSRKVVVSKRIVLLNDRGQPVQGMIYGGRDDLVGSVRFAYDDLGRMLEEISLNSQGEVFRRKIHTYDAAGNPLPTKIVDYSKNAPQIASNTINFTNTTAARGQAVAPTQAQAPAAGSAPKQPGEAPQIQKVSPRGKPEEKKKRGLFDIFKKKE
jgi:hypothetical protein